MTRGKIGFMKPVLIITAILIVGAIILLLFFKARTKDPAIDKATGKLGATIACVPDRNDVWNCENNVIKCTNDKLAKMSGARCRYSQESCNNCNTITRLKSMALL